MEFSEEEYGKLTEDEKRLYRCKQKMEIKYFIKLQR